jgi:tetratricopeptide (TPR) repeat protein
MHFLPRNKLQICSRSKLVMIFACLFFSAQSWAASLLEANEAFQKGDYRQAIELYKTVERGEAERAVVGMSRSYAMIGEYEQAINACKDGLDRFANSSRIQTQLAEVHFTKGESDRALELLKKVVSSTDVPLRSLVRYGEYLRYRGKLDEGAVYLNAARSDFSSRISASSEDTALAARAEWKLGNFQDANNLFREAARQDRFNAEAQVWWGDLFADKFNEAEAVQSYQMVLQYNPLHVDAIVGLARQNGNKKALERALFTNPKATSVFTTYAELAMKQNKWDEASSYLNAALPNNAESLDVLIPMAGIAALKEQNSEYQSLLKQASIIRPNHAELYTRLAEYFANDYRFTEAVEFARKAVAEQKNYWPAYTQLGMNLIRLGEEEEGREVLEMAFEQDPYNVWTNNMLKVFDTLDTFITMESPHFKVRMDPIDAKVLWPYMEPLLEEAWTTLSKKYGYTPEAPVLIEVFKQREDFAVRSVGLPDLGPLVGICFGKVITLISPDTLTANWQEIAWHEFAHIVTLQMTKNRIPRWLSEGVSVFEEQQNRPEWGMRQDMDVVRALNDGKLYPIERIDDAFMNAQDDADLNLAYLQSNLVVEYVADAYNFKKLRELVQAYSSLDSNEVILERVFDKSVKEINQDFSAWLEKRVVAVDLYVHTEDTADDGAAHGHGVRNNSSAVLAELYNHESVKEHMLERIRNEPRDFQAYLQLGIVLFKEEQYGEAEKYLIKAKEICPTTPATPARRWYWPRFIKRKIRLIYT